MIQTGRLSTKGMEEKLLRRLFLTLIVYKLL